VALICFIVIKNFYLLFVEAMSIHFSIAQLIGNTAVSNDRFRPVSQVPPVAADDRG
jgi:hypothetical protein